MGHHYQRTGNYVQRGGAVPVLLNSIHKEPIQQGGALAVLRVANQVGGITNDGIKRVFPADYGHQQSFVHGQGIKHNAHSKLSGLLADAVKEPSVKPHHQKRQNIKFNI